METIQQGAESRRLDLTGPLTPLGLGQTNYSDRKKNAAGGNTIINIENITVQADDVADLLHFVQMLRLAGGGDAVGVGL